MTQALSSTFPYVCYRYYRIHNTEKVTLKHYIIKPAPQPFDPITVSVMPFSDWKDDLTFEELTKITPKLKGILLQTKNESLVYLDVVVEELNGCMHYPLNCCVTCLNCNKEYPCRFCHDQSLDTCDNFDRYSLKQMRCLHCNKVGPIGLRCTHCDGEVAKSFCPTCNYISMISYEVKPFFHCDACTFCRVGKKEDYKHCDTCRQCYRNECFDSHECDSSDYVCCVCHEELKTSIYEHCELPCKRRHYIHISCFDKLLDSHNYVCPLCRKFILRGESLSLLTEEYRIFFLLYIFLIDYATVVFVPDELLVKTYDGQTDLTSSSIGSSDCNDCSLCSTSSNLHSVPESESESESESSHPYEDSEDHVEVQVERNQDIAEDPPQHNQQAAVDNVDADIRFEQYVNQQFTKLLEMKYVKFCLQKDKFLQCPRMLGKCRECEKNFMLPKLQLSDVPCVHCGVFNVDILTSKDAVDDSTDESFYEDWHKYIEGYILNVEKHTRFIHKSLLILFTNVLNIQ